MTKMTRISVERCGSGHFALKSSQNKGKSLKSIGFEAFEWQREKDSNPHIRSQSFAIETQKSESFQPFAGRAKIFVITFVITHVLDCCRRRQAKTACFRKHYK